MDRAMIGQRTEAYCLRKDEQMCFIHIPKTAGTTMSSILESRFDHAFICPTPNWHELQVMPPEQLSNYQLFRGHFPYSVSTVIPKKAVFITMLRDPIERVISAYEFMKTCLTVHPCEKKIQEKALTLCLKDYVRDPEVNGVVNAQTIMIAGCELENLSVAATEPKWLEVAKEHLQTFAWVGITEQFWPSVGVLSYQFGWPPPDQIQPLMVGKKKLRREALTQDVIDAIAECNQLDLELYDYAKSIFEQQYQDMIQTLEQRYGEQSDVSSNDVSSNNVSSNNVSSNDVSSNDVSHKKIARVRSLLECHYRDCFAQAHPPERATERLVFSFDQAIPGSGWHRLEGLERNEPFRWTGPKNVSTLDFPLRLDQDLALEFRILNSTTSDVLQSFHAKANGHPLALVPLHCDESGAILRCALPRSMAAPTQPFTRLSFHVDHTISFNTIDNTSDDQRHVGLAISLVQCFPVGSLPTVKIITSPIDSAPWLEAIAFLNTHIQSDQTVFAPNTFWLTFADYMPYCDPETIDLTVNYSEKSLHHYSYDWVVIHKGVHDGYMGWLLLQVLFLRLKPVLSNSVFVIFAQPSALPSAFPPEFPRLSYFSPNVRSAFTRYIKHFFQDL